MIKSLYLTSAKYMKHRAHTIGILKQGIDSISPWADIYWKWNVFLCPLVSTLWLAMNCVNFYLQTATIKYSELWFYVIKIILGPGSQISWLSSLGSANDTYQTRFIIPTMEIYISEPLHIRPVLWHNLLHLGLDMKRPGTCREWQTLLNQKSYIQVIKLVKISKCK